MSTFEELEEQLDQRERELAELSMKYTLTQRELSEIKSSTAWGLMLAMSRLGRRLVPQRSLRDRALWQVICGVRATRRALYRRGRGIDVRPTLPSSSITAEGVSVLARPRPGTYDLLILPIIDWTFRFQRPQQIASRLAAAGHRVFYVSTAFGSSGTTARLRPLGNRVVGVELPGPQGLLPYGRALDPGLCATWLAAVRQLRSELNIHDAVCFVDLPFWTPLALALREQFGWRIVYDCMDHHAGFPHSAAAMLEYEERLSRASDVVLVTSQHLLDAQRRMGVCAVHVPNATDFEHFRFAVGPEPNEVPRGQGPIVGYYGAISEWFDSELVANLARARPGWQFVLIGHTVGASLVELQGIANVHLVAEQPYAELPRFLHAFDVCVIPFRKTPLTDATNPVKLFEYLSAGKPVVATELDELKQYAQYVALARDESDWLRALDAAINEDTPVAREARIAFARDNSWDHRVAEIKQRTDALFPLASIIIVTYNNVEVTRQCLDSIYRKTAYPQFEVIVVDNASTDGTREFLESFGARHKGFRTILQDHNGGFAQANNVGLAAARGEFIVFLNNDTIVTPGWLSRLLYYLRDDAISMVGPVTNSSGNESRIEVGYTTPEGMESFAEEYTRAHVGETFDIRMLALFCVALRKSTVERAGELDEQFGIGMFEDDDYALRVKQLGLRIVCAEDVFVHHWGGASFSKLEREMYDRLFAENKRKFEAKWGGAWQPHQYRAALRVGAR